MKGGDGYGLRRFPRLVQQALAHFPGRPIGEGDGEDRFRSPALPKQMADLANDDAGFPAARARKHQQGAIKIGNGASLGRVKLHGASGNERRSLAGRSVGKPGAKGQRLLHRRHLDGRLPGKIGNGAGKAQSPMKASS